VVSTARSTRLSRTGCALRPTPPPADLVRGDAPRFDAVGGLLRLCVLVRSSPASGPDPPALVADLCASGPAALIAGGCDLVAVWTASWYSAGRPRLIVHKAAAGQLSGAQGLLRPSGALLVWLGLGGSCWGLLAWIGALWRCPVGGCFAGPVPFATCDSGFRCGGALTLKHIEGISTGSNRRLWTSPVWPRNRQALGRATVSVRWDSIEAAHRHPAGLGTSPACSTAWSAPIGSAVPSGGPSPRTAG